MALAVALGALVVATATDLRQRVVPNALTASLVVVGVVLAVAQGTLAARSLAAAVTVVVLLGARALGHVLSGRPGLGLGDVKLGAGLGLLLGWTALWAFYLAAVLGAVAGVAGVAAHSGGHRTWGRPVPFVPFILGGVALASTALPFAQVWGWLAP